MVTRALRLVAVVTGCTLVCGVGAGLSTGPAPAYARPDEPGRQDLRRTEHRLERAGTDLDESSARLKRATQALHDAETGLAGVRDRLAEVRGRLAGARAEDASAAEELAAARAAVGRARGRLAEAERKVSRQRRMIGDFARAAYQQRRAGDIIAILGSGGPGELLDRLHLVSSITRSQAAALDRLNALRAEVAARRAELEARKAGAERRRREAAARLARVDELERRVEEAEAEQARLVAARTAARAEAERARAEDRHRYAELLAERRRIRQVLQRLARQEAAAAARRAREDRAREDRNREQARAESAGERRDGPLSTPVEAPVTSAYGRRLHPILQVWKLHDGTDFGAPCGTAVRAAAKGRVVAVYSHVAYGTRVLVAHGRLAGRSTVTAYNHLSGTAVGEGDRVDRGETIGYVGSTGYSTGCHLHFMVYRDGSTVDPMAWL